MLNLIFTALNIAFLTIQSTLATLAKKNSYPDLLNVQNTKTVTDEVERSFFSDLGARHAYALPQLKPNAGRQDACAPG